MRKPWSLIEHGSMMPYAVLGVREGGGEGAAVRAALEAVPLTGRMVTFDALHTNAAISRLVVEAHGADWMTAVKRNTPEHLEAIGEIDWGRDATARWSGPVECGHGRIERRSIEVFTPVEGMFAIPHVKQVLRVTREREEVKGGGRQVTEAYGLTSDAHATPERLLMLNRGHWSVEAHHNVRDATFKEDACRLRTGHGPANSATLNVLAIAVIKRWMATHKALAPLTIAGMRRRFAHNRHEALEAMLGPAHA